MAYNKPFAKKIAGEIVLSDEPGAIMKKWRQIFMVRQCDMAKNMEISPSVISDYESGRRKSPGTGFVKKFIETLISTDIKKGGVLVERLSSGVEPDAIIDIRDFLEGMPAKDLIDVIEGEVVVGEIGSCNIWGYTVIDSIKAILELSEMEFRGIYGASPERALIFTHVHMGRSPMIAVKVTQPKPNLIILHGLRPKDVDKLALKIAKLENVPLVVSRIKDEDELVKRLRGFV